MMIKMEKAVVAQLVRELSMNQSGSGLNLRLGDIFWCP